MAYIKTLKFVNGIPKEINPEVDQIAALSFKVGGASGTELTKALLDTLLGGGDASALHNHDTLYYTKAQIDAQLGSISSGGSDALDAEIARATDAENALDARLDVIESDLPTKAAQTDLDAEIARATAAEAQALADAKTYTDAQVAQAKSDIMGGIPDSTLDTIKEIADALIHDESVTSTILGTIGDHETRITTLETDLGAEIARATAAEGTNASDIAAEIARATAAEGAEVSRATAAEGVLQDNIDAESARAIAAEAAEADARAVGDQLLQDSIDQLQTDLTQEASDRTAADGVLDGKITQEIADRQQAIIDEASARSTADGHLQDQIDALSAGASGDNAALAARLDTAESNIGQLQTDLTQEISDRTQGDIDTLASANAYTDTKVADLVNSAPATLDTLKELADALGDDPNFATTVSTNIGTNAAAIAAEILRATAAEGVNATAIGAETARATAAEGVNATAIGAETARATAAEGVLQDNIDAAEADIALLQSDLADEIARATAAEGVNATAIGTNAAAIAAEILRATAAEGVNTTAIGAETARATAAEAKKVDHSTTIVAGVALADGELVVQKWSTTNSRIEVVKASSAGADNADFNNGSWAVLGAVVGATSLGASAVIKKAIGDIVTVSYDVAPANADINKAVYLGTNGKATLTVPSDSGAGIVYLGVCAGPTSMVLCPAILRGVLD